MNKENYKGLTSAEALEFGKGRNVLTPPPSIKWYELLMEKFKDPIIVILIVADIFSFVVNIIENEPMWEPLAILTAILLTVIIGFYQDWSANKEFESLNKVSDDDLIKVVRDGKVTEVPKCDICIGDLVILSAGDEVCADMELVEATELHIEESAMTGESVPVTKSIEVVGNPTIPSNVALRGTNVTEGSGKGIVTKVGDNTNIGQLTRQAQEMTDEKTPLTIQLEKLAGKISKLSFWLGGALLAFLNIHHFGFTEFDPSWTSILAHEVEFIMIAVVIIIAAVPEGLSLSVVLALAYSVKAMMKDNNLVKKMKATETVGALNIIFSDKTGTLTKNQMTVVETDFPDEIALSYNVINNMAVNSTANLDGNKVIGNPTEGAILKWLKGSDVDYTSERENAEIRSQKPFNSNDKYMLTIVANKNARPKRGKYQDLCLVKGAPEVIFKLIGNNWYKYYKGDEFLIDSVKGEYANDPVYNFLNKVEEQQERGRRAISFASGPSMDDLHYDGSVFIEDPVRDDVPEAVAACYEAGIDVVMMTGDNAKTAAEIAHQAGFNRKLQNGTSDKIWAIEAKDFDKVAWGYPNSGYPNVIARCKPEDKLHIMKRFQELNKIVAMTGDGVNDSPSLNHANVGFAMGSGTSVAKEASDIVLLDDSFPSIVKGVKWGRSLYKNIQSFLGFQLTVNVALCLTAICGPLLGIDSPFSVIEILYINLVMDALGALALASEPAMDNVLKDKPRDINEFIINKPMTRFIGSTGIIMFLFMIFIILNMSNGWWTELQGLGSTGLFAIFMTANWMNLFRARSFGKNINVFSSLGRNKLFVFVCASIFIMNFLIVQFGGSIFGTHSLNIEQWGLVALVSFMIIAVSSFVNRIWDGK